MNWDLHLKEFEEYLICRDKSETTIKKYLVSVKQMLDYIGKSPLDITQKDLDSYKVYLKRVYDDNSLAPYISSINHFFQMLEKPYKLKAPAKKTKNIVPLSEGEVKKLFAISEKDPTAHAILTTLYYGMLRNTELCNLNISDLDFTQCKIRVNNGKGGQNSNIHLHPIAMSAIQRYLEKARVPSTSEPDALFTTQYGNRMSKTPLTQLVKQWAARTGIRKRVYPHLFRHSCISHMADNGAPLPVIQRQSRHKNIESLMVYVHPNETIVKETYLNTVACYDKPDVKETSIQEPLINERENNDNKSLADKLTDALLQGKITQENYMKALEEIAKIVSN